MTNYYDLVLGLIPLTVVGIAGLLLAVGIDMSLAAPVGAVFTIPLIGHAMFVRAPGQDTRNVESQAMPGESPQTEQTGMTVAD